MSPVQVNPMYIVIIGIPKSITNKLQQVLNAAARVVGFTSKFNCGLMQLIHANLHWLHVPQSIKYKLCVMMH